MWTTTIMIQSRVHIITYAQATAILVLRWIKETADKGCDTNLYIITYVIVVASYYIEYSPSNGNKLTYALTVCTMPAKYKL